MKPLLLSPHYGGGEEGPWREEGRGEQEVQEQREVNDEEEEGLVDTTPDYEEEAGDLTSSIEKLRRYDIQNNNICYENPNILGCWRSGAPPPPLGSRTSSAPSPTPLGGGSRRCRSRGR